MHVVGFSSSGSCLLLIVLFILVILKTTTLEILMGRARECSHKLISSQVLCMYVSVVAFEFQVSVVYFLRSLLT